MEKRDVLEYNRLIARYMGWKYVENDLVFNSHVDGHKPTNSVFSGWIKEDQPYVKGVPLFVVKANRGQVDYLRKLQYDTSWDWLMPVCIKICEQKFADGESYAFRTFGVQNEENKMFMVRFNRMNLFEAETLIEATFLAVVDAIKLQKDF